MTSELFDKWYQHYPLKVSKGAARKAFAKLNPSEVLMNKMINAIHAQIQHRKLMTAAGQFVPPWKYPATWIRAECWEDELPMVETRLNGFDRFNDIEATAKRLGMTANPGESWEQFGLRVRRASERTY
jgi:hypothetical protein